MPSVVRLGSFFEGEIRNEEKEKKEEFVARSRAERVPT